MTVVKREVSMIMPSITFCDYGKGNINDMLLDCWFGFSYKRCLKDNVTVYAFGLNKMTCLRFNFGSNATILQKTEGEGIKYGYEIMFYIPKDADVW